MNEFDSWIIFGGIYTLLAFISLLPTLFAIIKGVELHEGGKSFNDSPHFSKEARIRLSQHFSRIAGTLGFWKKQSETYRRFHYYTLFWTIPMTIVVPFLVQAISADDYSKWVVTLITAHTAITFSFYKAFKVDVNFRTWRMGESNFYDYYRRMLDRPETFGSTEEEQLRKYFDDVENLRSFIRNAEVENMPFVEEVAKQVKNEKVI